MRTRNLKPSWLTPALKIITFTAIVLVASIAHAQTFIEGTHYSTIERTSSQNPPKETVEYFSFSCPGCFAMEPHINVLKKQQPTLKLRRVHLPFGGPNAKLSQKAFALMELLNAEKHHASVFNRIHIQKNPFNNQQELIDFFETLGYDKLKVSGILSSFSTDTMIRKMNLESKKNNIRTVPTIIVNGKYQVNTRSVFSGANLTSLIEFLDGLPQ